MLRLTARDNHSKCLNIFHRCDDHDDAEKDDDDESGHDDDDDDHGDGIE